MLESALLDNSRRGADHKKLYPSGKGLQLDRQGLGSCGVEPARRITTL